MGWTSGLSERSGRIPVSLRPFRICLIGCLIWWSVWKQNWQDRRQHLHWGTTLLDRHHMYRCRMSLMSNLQYTSKLVRLSCYHYIVWIRIFIKWLQQFLEQPVMIGGGWNREKPGQAKISHTGGFCSKFYILELKQVHTDKKGKEFKNYMQSYLWAIHKKAKGTI